MNEDIQLILHQRDGITADDLDHEWMTGANSLIIDPCRCDSEAVLATPVDNLVLDSSDFSASDELRERKTCRWIGRDGLQETAKLRDEWKDLEWVPRLDVYRPSMSYRFSGPAIGEGFSFYIPDTSAIRGWRVTDGDMPLAEAAQTALSLGFTSLWLHSLDAENDARGLELEMLDRTRGSELDIWVSGGISVPAHLQNLVRAGGASMVVVDDSFARQHGMQTLVQALQPTPPEPVTTEVNVTCGQGLNCA